MNWEKLGSHLRLTENKMGNLNKINLFTFQTQRMRYSIASNFKNLSIN